MPNWLEVVLRAFTLVIVLFFLTKWLGKRHLTQLNIFEYITGIVLGSIVAIHSFDPNTNLVYGFLALLVWFIIPFTVDWISLKNKSFRNFTQGKATIFIQNGKVLEDNLKKERYTAEDLLEGLRNKGFFDIAQVEFATLEPSGTINVLPKKETQALTAKDIGLRVAPKQVTETVIIDGVILLEPLANAGLNPNWLQGELDKLNIIIENVFIGQVDSDGQLTVDLYDDAIDIPEPTEIPLMYATLKKCQADLELFTLATENPKSKQMYRTNAKKMQQAIDLIEKYV